MAYHLLFYLLNNELPCEYLKEIACGFSILLESQGKIVL